MTINAGVWIDHHKAVILLINEQGEDLREIISDDTKVLHAESGQRANHSYTRNDFVAEDKLERKAESHLNKYYDQVIACLHDADSIWILNNTERRQRGMANIPWSLSNAWPVAASDQSA